MTDALTRSLADADPELLIRSVPVILSKVSDQLYRICPRSSFADFLSRWLLDAMLEFKGAEFKGPEIP